MFQFLKSLHSFLTGQNLTFQWNNDYGDGGWDHASPSEDYSSPDQSGSDFDYGNGGFDHQPSSLK